MIEQLSIFDIEVTTSTISSVQTDRVYTNISGTTGFTFPVGTNVLFNFSKNAAVYEVVEDNGEMVNVKFTGVGYRNSLQDFEMTVSNEQIQGIVEGEDLIQLPQQRPTTLDLEFYRNRAAKLLAEIAQDRNKQLDFITYYLLVSPSNVVNSEMEWIWQHLLKEDVNHAVEYRIFSKSNYAKKHDFHELIFHMYHTGGIDIKFEKSEFLKFHVSDIIKRFYEMLDKFKTIPIEQLSPYELMVFYRMQGYLLTYRAGTDEWYFQHPDSSKIMYIENKTDLYNVESLIVRYEEQFTKHIFLSDYMVSELDLFETETTSNLKTLEGFVVPSGTIVQLTSTHSFSRYVVIEDDGTNVQLHDQDEPDNVMTVSSTLMRYFYPYKNPHLSVKLPRFNRPKDLTIETLAKRDTQYYHGLSEKEFFDAAVYRAVCNNGETLFAKIFRALIEGDEEYTKQCIRKKDGGISSATARFESKGNLKQLEFGLRGESRNISLNTNQIMNHLYEMLQKTKEFAFNLLSITELQIAYYVRGYNLKYDTVTDEFTLWQGIYSYDVKGHRAVLNDFDKTIELFERGKQ